MQTFDGWPAAGYGAAARAFGMIGSLIGLVQMLQNLDDPSKIGGGMAVALITTFYGAILANVVFLPLAGKLGQREKEEVLIRLKPLRLYSWDYRERMADAV